MSGALPRIRPATKPVGHDTIRGGLRFLAELVAWVAAPWALWPHSIPLAILVLVLLIAPPAVFGSPGDRPGGDPPIAAPGIVTILSVVAHLAAATAAAWASWPAWLAVAVTALCITVIVTEQPRWKSLLATRHD
jgi:hypothetical protein